MDEWGQKAKTERMERLLLLEEVYIPASVSFALIPKVNASYVVEGSEEDQYPTYDLKGAPSNDFRVLPNEVNKAPWFS